jgi:hypothetical protein
MLGIDDPYVLAAYLPCIAQPQSGATAFSVRLLPRKSQQAPLDLCFRKEGPGAESPSTK